ncbi:AAA family ATPase [Pseudoduganella sp. FT26W]|uniref:DNA 3'-5' helicase II n=1 Tax=Duganella aquatilis TaxID=2666082 RepID=A0A844CYC8_9BURK|nr:NERD domain-containing protein/DEAD/DEAH box helicase [Duganella aquatilis]MRW83751.1 AAA family ATPase [Duganella aquatilis]
MARMIPLLDEERLRAMVSRAEARFYAVCRDQLPNDFLVIYSANWLYRDGRGRVNEGEADFTLVSPTLGILAVEVKGGGVHFDPAVGAWHSIDRNGRSNPIKDPFRQASSERHALLDQIAGHANWRQFGGERFTLGHAVVFPDIHDAVPLLGPDRQRDIVGVNADLGDVSDWVRRVMRFWHQPIDAPLGVRGVRVIEGILCNPIDVRPVLRATVDQAEAHRVRLTANQAKVLRVIGGRRRAVVSGGAGTGKTLLAVEKAKQLADQGLNVLLLCYNRPLANFLAQGLRDTPRIQAQSYHQLCDQRARLAAQAGRDVLAEATQAYPGTGEKLLFDLQLPFALALSAEVLQEGFDAVVVDEAQDFSDEYWLGVEMLLSDQERGHFYIFIDQNQALYSRIAALPIEDEPFRLTMNCRNTAPIHEAAYRFYRGDAIDSPELQGPPITWISHDKDADQADAVARRVHQWINVEGIEAQDVAVLVTKRPKAFYYSLLQQRADAGKVRLAIEMHNQRSSVLLDTVARFKGLESQAVVLWLGDEVLDEELWETVYVGITRGKTLLTVVGTQRSLQTVKEYVCG